MWQIHVYLAIPARPPKPSSGSYGRGGCRELSKALLDFLKSHVPVRGAENYTLRSVADNFCSPTLDGGHQPGERPSFRCARLRRHTHPSAAAAACNQRNFCGLGMSPTHTLNTGQVKLRPDTDPVRIGVNPRTTRVWRPASAAW